LDNSKAKDNFAPLFRINPIKNKMRLITFLLIMLIVGTMHPAFAQMKIQGRVTEKDTSVGIPYAVVYIEDGHSGIVTDRGGYFSIPCMNIETCVLVAGCVGYKSDKFTVNKPTSDPVVLKLEEIVTDLPEAVVNASSITGGLAGLKSMPGSAVYLSPKEIAKFSYSDINRTLRAVPGVNLQEEDGFGLRPNIGIRGTGSERTAKITIMEDGVLISPAPYSAPAAYYFPTIGRMQAVEISKGSSQIQYGPFTTGGAINLISTTIPSQLKARLHVTGGSFGAKNIHAYTGTTSGQWGYLAETYQYSADGFKNLDGGGNTGFNKTDYLIKVRWSSKAKAKVQQSFQFKYSSADETSHETYMGLTQTDFETDPYRRYAGTAKDQMVTAQQQMVLNHYIKISKALNLSTTLYQTQFKRNWYKLDRIKDSSGTAISIASLAQNPAQYSDAYQIITGGTSFNNDALEVKANNRSYATRGIQTLLTWNKDLGSIKHHAQWGVRAHEDGMDRFQYTDKYAMKNGAMLMTTAGIPGTESNRLENARALSSFVLYKLAIGNFTLTPGLRYENVQLSSDDYGKSDVNRTGKDLKSTENRFDAWIPGISADYKINRIWSSFAGIHKGFAPGGSNEESKPESSINYELGARFYRLHTEGRFAFFLSDYANLLGSDLAAAGGAGSGLLFNGGNARVLGFEGQGTYDPLSGKKKKFHLPLTLVYTYTDGQFLSSFKSEFEGWGTVNKGDNLPYLAKHQVALLATVEHRYFSVTLSSRYNGAMRTIAGSGDMPILFSTDDALIADIAANYHMHRYFDLFGTVTNIFNDTYIVSRNPAGARPGLPRAFNFGMKFNL
jgi:Fe(3+) dicitrate transport protein